MAVTIVWTDEATEDLRNIYDYYNIVAGFRVAENMVIDIVESSFQLKTQPYGGQKEPLLKSRELEYRYIVAGNYKLIYQIDKTNVYIASVFDCRQNPEKIQNI
jgi:plasmid stabilization system protein ParE